MFFGENLIKFRPWLRSLFDMTWIFPEQWALDDILQECKKYQFKENCIHGNKPYHINLNDASLFSSNC